MAKKSSKKVAKKATKKKAIKRKPKATKEIVPDSNPSMDGMDIGYPEDVNDSTNL